MSTPWFSLSDVESVRHLAGLADLDLSLVGDALADEGAQGRANLTDRQTDVLGDGVGELGNVAQALPHERATLSDLTLLLGVSALALGVGAVELGQKLLRLGGDVLRHLSVDDGQVELTVSHSRLLS